MKKKISLFTVLFFLSFCFCLHAQDAEEMSLFQIDRLIRDTEYDEALQQLNVYIKNHPENFDGAQSRIKKIMEVRIKYSVFAEKLIEIIQNEPENSKKIYEITSELEKFEKNPSDKNLQFIADLKKSAEFNYFRSIFMENLNKAAELTEKKQYVAAVAKLQEGFWLYRDEFYEEWKENEKIILRIEKIISNLNEALFVYQEKNYLAKLNDSVAAFVKSVYLRQPAEILVRYGDVKKTFENYAKVRNVAFEAVETFRDIKAELYSDDSGDASFPSFMIHFLTGLESIENSGFFGTFDSHWNMLVKNMNDAVFTALQDSCANFTSSFDQKNLIVMNENLENVVLYADLQRKILDLYGLLNSDEENPVENPLEYYYVLCNAAQNICEKTDGIYRMKTLVATLKESAPKLFEDENSANSEETKNGRKKREENFKTNNQNQKFSSSGSVSDLKSLYEFSFNLYEIAQKKSDYEIEKSSWYVQYKNMKKSLWNGLLSQYIQLEEEVFTKTKKMQCKVWAAIAEIYKNEAEVYVGNLCAMNDVSSKFANGISSKISEKDLRDLNKNIEKSVLLEKNLLENESEVEGEADELGILYSYPDLSEKLSVYVSQKCLDVKTVLNDYIAEIRNSHEKSNVKGTVGFNTEVSEIAENLLETLNSKILEIEVEFKKAENQIVFAKNKIHAAELAKNEADIRFTEAENALKNFRFDVARKKLQDSLKKYDESLNNQNDEKLRTDCDRKIYELGQNIAKKENEVVVKDVRELKNLAKDAYFNGRFEDSEKYLNQAKTRWAVTNAEPDEEIINLSNFVNAAISMKTGRDLPISAPQYPEMSQLLNVAYKFFDEGSRKIAEGNKDDGLKDLEVSLKNIQKLQFVYPLNQEASILTLKINRLKDPKKFSEELSQKINAAKLMCENPNTKKEGYANLKDYYELEPDYKGLKDLIYKIEIDLGIRPKKVDNSGVVKAKNLLAEARKLYKNAGNDEKKLKAAREKVDESLALVMDNPDAIKLKDEITTKIGGTVKTSLTIEEERLYQLSIQKLQANNVIGAKVILDRILQVPSNGSLQKIQDLKNKIEARS